MRRALLAAPVALVGLWVSHPVAAQEEDPGYVQLVNEFFLTTSVYPQERGEVQLTTYPHIDFEDGHRAAFPLAVEFGVTDRWQIEVEWVALATSRPDGLPSQSGTGDVELETQYSFMNVGGSPTHVALGFGVTLPAGSEEAGGSEGEVEFEPSISVGRDLVVGGRPGQLFGQLSMGLLRSKDDPAVPGPSEPEAHELQVGLGYVVAAGDVRWTAELAWTTNEWDGGDETEFYFAPGLVWDLPDTWEVGVGVPIGVGGEANSWGISLFVLYEFELGDED